MAVRNPITGFPDVLPQQSLGRSNLRSTRTPNVPTNKLAELIKAQNQRNQQMQQDQPASRSGFVSAMQNVGGALSPLLSGEEFINLVTPGDMGTDIRNKLEDIPTIGGFLGVAFDVGASPLTLLTGGAGGAIGGSRLVGGLAKAGFAGRAAAGTTRALTSPLIQRGNIAQRIGAETALFAGAESAQKALDLPAWTQLVGVGVGLKGLRGAQKTAVGRTLFGEPGSGINVQVERIAEKAFENKKLSQRVLDQAEHRKINPDQVMSVNADYIDDINSITDIGMNRSRQSFLKGQDGMSEAMEMQANNLRSRVKATGSRVNREIKKYSTETDKRGNRVFANKDGIVLRSIHDPEKPALVGDVLEYLDTGYTKAQLDQIDPKLYNALAEMKSEFKFIEKEKILHGLEIQPHKYAPLEEGQAYIPRYAQFVDSKKYQDLNVKSKRKALFLNRPHDRTFETFYKGASKQTYEDPVEALSHYADDAAKDIINHELSTVIARFANSGDTLLDWGTRSSVMRVVDQAVAADKKWKRRTKGVGTKGQRKSYVDSKNLPAETYDQLSKKDKVLFLRENPQFRQFAKIGVEGATFEKQVAEDLKKAFLLKTEKGKLDNLVDTINRVNSEIVPLRSTFDASGGLVTNAIAMWNNPIGFWQNYSKALADTGVSNVLTRGATFGKKGTKTGGERVDDLFDSIEVKGGTRTETKRTLKGKVEVEKDYVGAAKFLTLVNPDQPYAMKEFIIGDGESKMKQYLKKGLTPFNRNFAMVGNRNRITMFYDAIDVYGKAMKKMADEQGVKTTDLMDDSALREIGRAVDRATGIASAKAGDKERALLFAPNFYRSMFETIGNLSSDGTLEGDLARKYMTNMISGGTAAVAGWAMYTGRDPSEVLSIFDGDALEKGELKMNPNFGTMRLGNRDVNIWGPYDSLVRLAIGSSVMGSKLSEEKEQALKDYFIYATRTKGSPVLSYLMNLQQGETFTGRDFKSVEGQLSQVLPFSLSVGLEEGGDALAATDDISEALIQGGLGSLFSASGMKENPVSPYEELDMLARAKKEFGNRPYGELTPQERAVIDQENPAVVARLEATNRYNRSPEGKMAKWRTQDQEKLKMEQQLALQKLQTDGNRYEFRKIMDKLAERHSILRRAKEEEFEIEYDEPTAGTAKAVLSEYYNILDNSRDPLTGELDWDAIDANMANLESDIASGFYGPPDRAQEYLDERVVFKGNPNVEWFFDNKNTIRSVEMDGFNYWDQKDRAFDSFKKSVTKAAGRDVGTYNGLLEAIVSAIQENDIGRATVLKKIRNRIDRRTDIYRKLMRRKNPEVEKALMENGYLS